MTREEAIETVRRCCPRISDSECYFETAMRVLIPELAESEDERTRKDLYNFLTSPFIKEKLNDWRVTPWLLWLEKQKEQKPRLVGEDSFEKMARLMYETGQTIEEQKPVEYLPKHRVFDIMNKLTNLSYSELIPIDSEEYVKIHEITSDVNSLLDYPIEPKPVESKEYVSPDCGTSACVAESEHYSSYREGIRYALKQTEDYTIGKTFKGLIPCWVNAPSELQPAHKYHGKNVVIMHENNGGFRCVCIDDEKPVTFHLPEDTLFAEGWRKKPAEWSEEDEDIRQSIIKDIKWERDNTPVTVDKDIRKYDEQINWLKSLRPQYHGDVTMTEAYKMGLEAGKASSWKPSEEQMKALETAIHIFPVDAKNRKELELLKAQLKKL